MNYVRASGSGSNISSAEVATVLGSIPAFSAEKSVGAAYEAVLNTVQYIEQKKCTNPPVFDIPCVGVCREPAPDQQPDAGGNYSAAMPG
jgi:hypothetical protein